MVELLIAMVVGIIIMTAIYAMVNLSQGTSAGVGRRIATQQDSRAVLDLMAMEVSMVSFNPSLTNATWTGNMLGSCSAVTMVPARLGIQVAGNATIGLAMDLSANNVIGDVPNEYIVYNYDAANRTITRSTNCAPAEIILGGTGSPTMVRNTDTSPATPLFQYFNVAGTDISANVIATPDTNIPLIKRIRINIIADDPVVDPQGGSARVSRRIYSTDVLVRNHAFAP